MDLAQRLTAALNSSQAAGAIFIAALLQSLGGSVRADSLLADRVLMVPSALIGSVLAATAGSVLAGGVIYVAGWLLGIAGGLELVVSFGLAPLLVFVQQGLHDYGMWLLLAAGIASVPYGVLLALAGFLGAAPLFLLPAAVLARGIRYGVAGWLLWRGGTRYRDWLARYYQGVTLILALAMLLTLVFVLLLQATQQQARQRAMAIAAAQQEALLPPPAAPGMAQISAPPSEISADVMPAATTPADSSALPNTGGL